MFVAVVLVLLLLLDTGVIHRHYGVKVSRHNDPVQVQFVYQVLVDYCYS